MLLEWEHIFPDGLKRQVNVTVENDEVTTITYPDGTLLESSDYEDVKESLEQNADMAGGYYNLS